MSPLYERSIQIIKGGQSSTGAYIASPNFPTYSYCWLRDGSFIAHAMDQASEFDSARVFFRWVGSTIQKYSKKIDEIEHRLDNGIPIGKDDVLHTRFTLDGKEVTEDDAWGNFQIDGYGTWLWALAEHVRLSGDNALLLELVEPIHTTLRYLDLVWRLPNYDCWEEHPEYIHAYSLATVFAAFNSMNSLMDQLLIPSNEIPLRKRAMEVREFILTHAVSDGYMCKHIKPSQQIKVSAPVIQSGVDSSMIGLVVPYQVFSPDDLVMQMTIAKIERDLLRPGGGVYRYRADVYYGGGEWILLTAWLGWHYARMGRIREAQVLQNWIERQMTSEGYLPEQVSEHLLAPDHYEAWLNKWGPIASPLLWSHAMYVILVNEIKKAKQNE